MTVTAYLRRKGVQIEPATCPNCHRWDRVFLLRAGLLVCRECAK